jgi:hypothetical protein
MRRVRRGHVFGALIAEPWGVDPGEKVFPRAEEDRGNRKVHFVDESGAEILLDRGDPPPSRTS